MCTQHTINTFDSLGWEDYEVLNKEWVVDYDENPHHCWVKLVFALVTWAGHAK